MARNRYTAVIHKIERAQHEHQIKELKSLAYELRSGKHITVEVPPISDAKYRRSNRLATKRQHRPIFADLGSSTAVPADHRTPRATATPHAVGTSDRTHVAA